MCLNVSVVKLLKNCRVWSVVGHPIYFCVHNGLSFFMYFSFFSPSVIPYISSLSPYHYPSFISFPLFVPLTILCVIFYLSFPYLIFSFLAFRNTVFSFFFRSLLIPAFFLSSSLSLIFSCLPFIVTCLYTVISCY